MFQGKQAGGIRTSASRGLTMWGAVATLLATSSLAGVAHAQEAPAPGAVDATESQSTAAPEATESQASAPTEAKESQSKPAADQQDIVVTATRRDERLSRVPISVAAYSQDTLDDRGVRNIADLSTITPSLNFRPNIGGSNAIDIRGIASLAGSPTTGVYIDDTPIQSRNLGFFSQIAYPAVFDLERVEVLRGPQGTLFGAASQGGTVRFISGQPNLTRSTLYARGEVGLIDGGGLSYEGGAAVGVPLIPDRLAIRASASYRRDGGWIDRQDFFTGRRTGEDINTADTIVLRAAVKFAPSDAFSITPSIYYQRRDADATANYWTNLSDPSRNRFVTGDPIGQPSRDRFILPALSIEGEAGGLRLISTTSYFDRKFRADIDFSTVLPVVVGQAGGLPVIPEFGYPGQTFFDYERNHQKNFTQEVRIAPASSGETLNWSVGLFYNRSKQSQGQSFQGDRAEFVFRTILGLPDFIPVPPNVQPGNYLLIQRNRTDDTQIAGFANVDYNFTPLLKATIGARIAHVKSEFRNVQAGPLNFGDATAFAKSTATPFTPKVALNYQATPDSLFYVSAAKGYRIGGGNAPVLGVCGPELAIIGLTSTPTAYKPDSLWSYEIGAKNRFFDRRLQVDASAFVIDWSDIQQQVFFTRCNFQYVANLGKVRSKGFDVQASLRASDNLTLGASVGYTKARYTENVYPGSTQGTGPNSVIVSKNDIVGNGAAPWTVVLTGRYEQPVSTNVSAYLNADFTYRSHDDGISAYRDPASISYNPTIPNLPASSVLNLRAGAQVGDADISVFVRNLTQSSAVTYFFKDYPGSSYFKNVGIHPRTFGLTVTFKN